MTLARNNELELIAPAGSPAAGYAALTWGADAIYLGLRQFSARAEATNFTLDELSEIIAYAHGLQPRRRVYVALNTLILQRELPALVDALAEVADLGADAVIVQDLGVAWIARRYFPNLRLHASTQMAVHNRAGVEQLQKLGFARATLARELTLEEISDCAKVEGIEIEVFVHGALCYSYSGLCLMSSHLLGRSGNRGRCASPCRDYVSGPNRSAFAFNMKDLALPDQIEALRKAGVRSLKIEGRMKSELYVAAVVDFYRRLLDGTLTPEARQKAEADLRTLFSRPWTEGTLHNASHVGCLDTEFVGHRGEVTGAVQAVFRDRSARRTWIRFQTRLRLERHDGLQIELPGRQRPFGFSVEVLRVKGRQVCQADAGSVVEVPLPEGYPPIPLGATVCRASSQEIKRRYVFQRPRPGQWRVRKPIEVAVRLEPQRMVVRAAIQGADPLGVESLFDGPFEPARDASATSEAGRLAFSKLGDTRFELRRFELDNPHGLFVPVSRWNAIRRAVVNALEAAHGEWKTKFRDRIGLELGVSPSSPLPETRFIIRTDQPNALSEVEQACWERIEEVVLDLSGVLEDAQIEEWAERLGRARIRLSVPLILRGDDVERIRARAHHLRSKGFDRWEATGLAFWRLWEGDPPQDVTADWPLYAMNAAAARQLLELGVRRFTLSPEDDRVNMFELLRQFGSCAVVILYQDTPLFISEHCVMAAWDGVCPGPGTCRPRPLALRLSYGQEIVALSRACRTIVISREPFTLAAYRAELENAGARRFRVDFCWRPYEPTEVRSVLKAVMAGDDVRGHPGNYHRLLA